MEELNKYFIQKCRYALTETSLSLRTLKTPLVNMLNFRCPIIFNMNLVIKIRVHWPSLKSTAATKILVRFNYILYSPLDIDGGYEVIKYSQNNVTHNDKNWMH